MTQALDRVREAARRRKKGQFTALLHHIDADTLRTAFYALKRKAAPGVDGMTWHDYEADLEPRIEDLAGRVHRGAYRPQPSRRTYIPKADGRQRPLAIAALEDKIVQGATVMALNAIYEGDFCGFSYGFRPGRGPHDALDALSTAKTGWRRRSGSICCEPGTDRASAGRGGVGDGCIKLLKLFDGYRVVRPAPKAAPAG